MIYHDRRYADADLAARRFTPSFAELMKFEVERTRGYFDRGAALDRRFHDTSRWYSSRRIHEERSAAKVLVARETGEVIGAAVDAQRASVPPQEPALDALDIPKPGGRHPLRQHGQHRGREQVEGVREGLREHGLERRELGAVLRHEAAQALGVAGCELGELGLVDVHRPIKTKTPPKRGFC